LLEDRKGSMGYPVERKFSDEDMYRPIEAKHSLDGYRPSSNNKAPENNQNKDLVE